MNKYEQIKAFKYMPLMVKNAELIKHFMRFPIEQSSIKQINYCCLISSGFFVKSILAMIFILKMFITVATKLTIGNKI